MGEVCHQTCVAPIISFEGLGNDRISQKSLQASSYYRKKHSSDTRYSHLASNLLCESGNTTFQLTKIINRSNFRQQQYREGRHNVDQRGCKRGGSSCGSPRPVPLGWGPLVMWLTSLFLSGSADVKIHVVLALPRLPGARAQMLTGAENYGR